MRSVGDAFSYVFRDSDWPVKLLLGSLFTALSVVLIGLPVVYGYYIEVLQRSARNDPKPLPEWNDPGVKFITGFKFIVTEMVYFLPVAVILIPLMLFLIISAAASQHSGLAPAVAIPFIILVLTPYSLFINLIMPLIAIRFARRERIRDGVNITEILRLFRFCWQDLLLILALSLMVSIGAVFGLLFLIVGILATAFYSHCVIFHLYGQLAATLDSELSMDHA